MSLRFKSLHRVLFLAVAAQAANAGGNGVSKMQPSDCRARDADSTCATAVAGVTVPEPPSSVIGTWLYDGPLGGVPASGYAYWGFDFIADQTGKPSPVRPDEFINRSNVPVTIKLSFTIPTISTCGKDCLPAVEFEVDAGWFKVDPPYVFSGNTASVSYEIGPGRGYGWVIALWQSSKPRLTVTVPKGSTAALLDVGMPALPAVANEIPPVTRICNCNDGNTSSCSDGTYFSNGLLGPWFQQLGNYQRAQAFNYCASGGRTCRLIEHRS